ncbi:MAG: ATP-binding cassette domain-containing protein [Spirochaetia bacterium]|nr:ATP-binding cassette domain-containing protein [Spirochaetia bacterium]
MKEKTASQMILLKNISFSYGKRNILNEINLEINQGSMVSLIGKSGSGKSTLLYLLGGFLKAQKGEYFFKDKPYHRAGEFKMGKFRKENIGYVFQDFRLVSYLSVYRNIQFPSFFTSKKVKKIEILEVMNKLGILHRKDAYPKDISGGEAQRTALGRALLLKPPLLLLDEPTGNLDEKTEKEILSLLLNLKKENFTIICVTHSNLIKEKSDMILSLENGKLIKIKDKKRKIKT